MKRALIHAVSVLFPTKNLRKKVRMKLSILMNNKITLLGKDNQIILIDAHGKKILSKKIIPDIQIFVKGRGNRIIFHTPLPRFMDSSIYLVGDNNTIEIGTSPHQVELDISCRWECHNRTIRVGDNFSCERTRFVINEDNAILNIGQDCMFSNSIEIRTDGHAILDEMGNALNSDCNITIGNHCWIATRCVLLKSASLPNGCILGACSLLTKKFHNENCIYAGVPAKQIRDRVSWVRENASIFKRRKERNDKT